MKKRIRFSALSFAFTLAFFGLNVYAQETFNKEEFAARRAKARKI